MLMIMITWKVNLFVEYWAEGYSFFYLNVFDTFFEILGELIKSQIIHKTSWTLKKKICHFFFIKYIYNLIYI